MGGRGSPFNPLYQPSDVGQVILSVHVFICEKGTITYFVVGLKSSVAVSTEKVKLTEADESQEVGSKVLRAWGPGMKGGSATYELCHSESVSIHQ